MYIFVCVCVCVCVLVGFLYIHMCVSAFIDVCDWPNGECLPMIRETGVLSQVKSYQRLKKWYLMLSYLTLTIIRLRSSVK